MTQADNSTSYFDRINFRNKAWHETLLSQLWVAPNAYYGEAELVNIKCIFNTPKNTL